MSQEEQSKKISPQDQESSQPKTPELSDKDLEKVAGGAGGSKLGTEELIISGRSGIEFLNPQPLPP